jgi:hypothetical protein
MPSFRGSVISAVVGTFGCLTIFGFGSFIVPSAAAPEALSAKTSSRHLVVDFDGRLSVHDVLKIMKSTGGEITRIAYSGSAAQGATSVPEQASDGEIEALGEALFARVDRPVPPVIQIEFDTAGATVTPARMLRGRRHVTDVRALDRAKPQQILPAVDSPSARQTRTLPAVSLPNYFPTWWQDEARNELRCVSFQYVGGPCQSWLRLRAMNQTFAYVDSSPTAWPDKDWGLEVDLSLWNDAVCSASTGAGVYQPGWWADAGTYQWVTDIPASADPYLDDNRASDACQRLTQSFGVGSPWMLRKGATYTFYIATKDYNHVPASVFSASFQATSNDCNNVWLSPNTNCMGLNFNRTWPYGSTDSPLVGKARGWTVPGCSRSRDGWSAPQYWANGARKLLPAPDSYYDTCLTNDW